MEANYEKKDITKSPKVKGNSLPEGWEMFEKRGFWWTVSPEGLKNTFPSEKEAMEHING